MSNLFSIFDPKTLLSLPLNWGSSIIILLLIPNLYWLPQNQMKASLTCTITYIYGEFSAIGGAYMAPGSLLLCLSAFLFIMLNNFMGLVPYFFTSSSHLAFTVALALPLWLGHTTMAWVKTFNSSMAHLVPIGTPYALMPFMVLIELVSSVIRPLTLSVRLAANMVAGHLLLTLLSINSPTLPLSLLALILLSLSLLCVLETAVALIQAYVFSVLSTLYLNEVNSFTMNN